MKVQCVICDRIFTLDDHSFIAKRLRNHPDKTFLCQECHDRITEKTLARLATGKFRQYSSRKSEDGWDW